MFKKYFIISISLLAVTAVVSGCGKNISRDQTRPIVGKQDEAKKENIASSTNTKGEDVSSSTNDMIATSSEIDTSDWQTYRNKEYGYSLMYPKNWVVKDVNYYHEELKMNIKYVSFIGDNYALTFLLGKIGDDSNSGRTGVGAGEFKDTEEFKVVDINITIKNLVYENKIREMFFSGKNETYNISGYFSYLGDAYNANFDFNTDKLKIAEKIIKSFVFSNK